jgi:hypothetical protein
MRLKVNADGIHRSRVEIAGSDDATARYLRQVKFGPAMQLISSALRVRSVGRELGDGWFQDVRRPGRRGRADLDYAEWAKRYVEAMARNPRAPIRQMVEDDATKGVHRTDDEVRAHVNKARDRGLLTRSDPGRPGGELTPKAKQLLDAIQRQTEA